MDGDPWERHRRERHDDVQRAHGNRCPPEELGEASADAGDETIVGAGEAPADSHADIPGGREEGP